MRKSIKIKVAWSLLVSSALLLLSIPPLQADVSSVSVALGTSTVNTPSTYTITFTTGSAGALTAASNDTIIITFPQNTSVPASIAAGSQITVNGNNITAAATGTGQTLTIITPVDIGNNTVVTVIINTGVSSLVNPSIPASTYTIDVSTSVETNPVLSSTYSITASTTTLNVGTVTPNPDTIGNPASYTIALTLSSDGALWGGNSQIVITFPDDTQVADGTITGVTVDSQAASSATGNQAARTITIVPSQDLANNYAFNIVIPSSAVRNPTTVSATYTLTVSTSAQPAGTSPTYNIGLSSTNVNITSVTPSPNTIGNAASYTIDFDTSADGALIGGTSQIIVTFPNDTLVTSGAITGVTVEGTAASSATGDSVARTVTIVPAQDISGSTPAVTIVIPSSALRNPTTSNNYTLSVQTSPQPAGTSPAYSIGQSATTVNVTSVTPNPSTVGNSAEYTIVFDTSSDGALIASTSTITVTFPADTSVRNGTINGITVNSTAASATGDSISRVITITVPQDISTSTTVTVVIPNASNNVVNPTTQGNYSLTVATSVQPAGTSPLYAIGVSSTPVNVTNVTPNPTVVGNNAAYTIDFITSSDGALQASTSQIIVTFPNDTDVPDGALNGILINGAAAQSATGENSTRRITIVPNSDIPGNTPVTVFIPLSVGVRNPTSTGNSYTLQVATSVQPSGTSPAYSITQSSTPVNVTNVIPTPSTLGSNTSYSISFDTSADGPLISGASHIIITFPDNTVVTTGVINGITVNGIAPSSATGSMAPAKIDIVVGSDIPAGSSNVTVVIPASEVQNPTTAGSYTLTVSTTAQPAGTSPVYNITTSSTQVNVTAVATSTNIVNAMAAYTVNFTPEVVLRANLSAIFLQFPYNAVVPNGAISNVTVGGTPAASASGDGSSRTITIVPNADVNPSVDTPVIIADSIIMNPSIPTTYAMGVSTTAQPTGTQTFSIISSSSTQISNISVSPNPSRAGQAASYTITFNVGANGRLEGGNVISIQFPAGMSLPASISAGNITVNSIANTGTIYADSLYFHVVVPPGVSVPNNGSVTVVFQLGAGLTNPSLGAKQLTDVHTDAEPTAVVSQFYWITANSQISTPQVQVSPDEIYATAQYTVVFTLGSEGSLTHDLDKIVITFPSSTSIPSSFSASEITVNGTPVTSVRSLSLYTIEITSPIDVSASASNKTITIVFSTAFGLGNPSLPGMYTLSAYTSIENTVVTSNPYQINPSTSTQITVPQITLSPSFTNSRARYQISFNVGSLGALAQDTSTITIIFPNEFSLPASINAEQITVNGQALNNVPTISNQTLTITTPVAIPLSGAVEIQIQTAAGITNPAHKGSYSFTLYTSSEPNQVQSNTIQIRHSTWDDVVSYPNPLIYDESTNKSFTFLFLPDQNVVLRIYTIDGKLVKTITKNDNSDRIVWDLLNEQRKLIASGIYIYIIKGSSGEKRGKIALLK